MPTEKQQQMPHQELQNARLGWDDIHPEVERHEMAWSAASEAASSAARFTADGVADILCERRWLAARSEAVTSRAIEAWLVRAAELLGPHAGNRAELSDLLSLVFSYEAVEILRQPENQAVLARGGARDVIRELANRVLDGGEIDSDRFKEIIDGMKSAVPQRSRELLHPVRLALAGRAGEGQLDRVILLLDCAAKLDFALPVKSTRQRILEFCAALD